MSMTNTNLGRVELILKELQQEKTCLAQKLVELRRKKEVLVKNVEVLRTRGHQARDSNRKLKETLKIAQNKVAQTQAQVETLQKTFESKRSHVSILSEQVDSMKKENLEAARDFEKQLSELADQFTEAKDYYNEINMANVIERTQGVMELLHQKISQARLNCEELSNSVKTFANQENGEGAVGDELATGQNSLLMLLSEEKIQVTSVASEIATRKCELEGEIQLLSSVTGSA